MFLTKILMNWINYICLYKKYEKRLVNFDGILVFLFNFIPVKVVYAIESWK